MDEWKIIPPEILNYQISLTKIKRITDRIKDTFVVGDNHDSGYPLLVLYHGLRAQTAIIEYLNDENLHCDIPWDSITGLPTFPTLVADVKKYLEIFRPAGLLNILLNSLTGWTLFAKQKLDCCCGSGFNARELVLHFMMHNLFRQDEDGFVIKGLLGIACDDKKHLIYHYDMKRPSQALNNLIIVAEEESALEISENKISCRLLKKEYSEKIITYENFLLIFSGLAQTLKQIPETKGG